ncbi:hypothetical protein [Glycomyces paridis]|uniref:Uncharacterized protein n=1 Tax=Glycomyces paridis TaxID=2126555 RepID=A0A4S8P4P7_9ACTN|nr:hypothetical protein [Glycomyces paridis]THV24345.1 hypothetical protein E9998_22255 [Glycomyces paridis]
MDTHTFRTRRLAGPTGLLAGALLLVGLAACGNGSGGDVETQTGAETTETASVPETTEEESPVPEETTPYLDPSLGEPSKSGSDSQTTITGTVESGIESGCLVLEYDGTVYGIFGSYDASVVYAGAQVTLHGQVDAGMMSTCQQGTPFVVEDAESAD